MEVVVVVVVVFCSGSSSEYARELRLVKVEVNLVHSQTVGISSDLSDGNTMSPHERVRLARSLYVSLQGCRTGIVL